MTLPKDICKNIHLMLSISRMIINFFASVKLASAPLQIFKWMKYYKNSLYLLGPFIPWGHPVLLLVF